MKLKLLLCLVLLLLLPWATLAQTARIAHFSHSGSLATLDAAMATREDNFGDICRHLFKVQTIVATSETTAVLHGKMVFVCMGKPVKDSLRSAHPRTATASWGGKRGQMVYIPAEMSFSCACSVATRPVVARRFELFYPEAQLIGFDSSQKFTPAIPVLKKQKPKRKKSAFTPIFFAPPRHPGVAMAVALILTLTGAGWLLGERPRPVVGSAA
ncbi:hypothetical protein [Hymenobacter ruricola]|uniref:Uncharacterized protein n=1 Tax=Hymenobacter ruricola TaxID=2791023 RepID=A0ABS0IBJ3_9BACT|nr:hypothetical protein [Hymenobacter ruricola]MBF9224336.1 hypothetical protein [Hymenobacter ruricola]